ncbi:hypothetical protein IFM89_002848 [Coptis chinensis]|uniref:Uncharacterized protein n=1 Tax=Coptis chinensis TaxID=261450 RepID=A0A835H5W9_9MAGN|nr:hypothetical protein IFM89_002848 [Coptis chinensis]
MHVSLLNRDEEVLSDIEYAKSTKKVKSCVSLSFFLVNIDRDFSHAEEVQSMMRVSSEKEVEDALGSGALAYTGIEDEDVEEEFKKLEMELGDEILIKQIFETVADSSAVVQGSLVSASSADKILSNMKMVSASSADKILSNMKMADSASWKLDTGNSVDSLTNKLSSLKLEAA